MCSNDQYQNASSETALHGAKYVIIYVMVLYLFLSVDDKEKKITCGLLGHTHTY